jgi:HPt (histidine-containing phosphotransfer) domain-containing protein
METGKPASRLRRMLDFCQRVLAAPGPPLDLTCERPALPEDELELNRLGQRFSNDLFARLLLELPAQRRALTGAYKTGDYRRLRDNIHQLLGATAYCDAPELDSRLRELQGALQNADTASIQQSFTRVISSIDDTLRCSGYRGNG